MSSSNDDNVTITFSTPPAPKPSISHQMPLSPGTPLASSATFVSFNASFPLHHISLQTPHVSPPLFRSWSFYQCDVTQQAETAETNSRRPLIIISDIYSTLPTFYQLILSLSAKQLPAAISHIYALSIPIVDSIEEFNAQFAVFCERMSVSRAHLLCMGPLGCLLGQSICDTRPDLGASLILINASGVSNSTWVQRNVMPELAVNVAPAFLLRKLVRQWGGIDRKYHFDETDEEVTDETESNTEDAAQRQQRKRKQQAALRKHFQLLAQSLQFVKHHIQQTPRKQLAAHVNLLTRSVYEVERLFLDDDFITIVEALDQTMALREDRKELQERYPNARLAQMKSGGDFPQLANSEEVLLHVEVHLRRVERLYEERDEERVDEPAKDDETLLREAIIGERLEEQPQVEEEVAMAPPTTQEIVDEEVDEEEAD